MAHECYLDETCCLCVDEERARLIAERDAALAENARLRHELRQENERLTSLQRRHQNLLESQERANAAQQVKNAHLDALLWVWCSGGCESGAARWVDLSQYGGRDVALNATVVGHAISNTKRLVSWWRNQRFTPLYEQYRASGHPWQEACSRASADLDRLYPETVLKEGDIPKI